MPTYEYACTSCAHEWEHEQSIKADPIKRCPACDADTARRQISRGNGFILKGGGWYSDLYSSSSNKPASGGADAKAVESGSGSATESKSGESSASSSSSTASSSESTASTTSTPATTKATPAATP